MQMVSGVVRHAGYAEDGVRTAGAKSQEVVEAWSSRFRQKVETASREARNKLQQLEDKWQGK
jgi:hypothetical protein